MKIKSKDYRVKDGDKASLKSWPTRSKSANRNKSDYQKILSLFVNKTTSNTPVRNQSKLDPDRFQGMDRAEKDGTILK